MPFDFAQAEHVKRKLTTDVCFESRTKNLETLKRVSGQCSKL